MGNANKKVAVDEQEERTRFSKKEIAALKKEFESVAKVEGTISKEQFKQILTHHIQSFAAGSMFLERLFDAFDTDGSNSIDIHEFIKGLSIFIKGTPEEKLELSFKFYDIDRDGTVTQQKIARVLTNLYSSFYKEDKTAEIEEMSQRWFEDLDVDGSGTLSFEEYKLSALKEPMVINFLEQFLVDNEMNK